MELARLSHVTHGCQGSWFHFPQASLAWEVREECWVEGPQEVTRDQVVAGDSDTILPGPGAALRLQFSGGPGDLCSLH